MEVVKGLPQSAAPFLFVSDGVYSTYPIVFTPLSADLKFKFVIPTFYYRKTINFIVSILNIQIGGIMAIENKNLAYSSLYDVYVDRTTYAIFKRNNRHRKSEITDSELIPLTLHPAYNGYIMFYDSLGHTSRGVYYIYADAFPELVEGSDLHQMDPDTYCQIDHRNHIHDTLESNFPANLRWVSAKINHADTSRRVKDPTEKQRKQLDRMKDYYNRKKQDQEWVANRRKADTERKRNKYYENKEKTKAHKALLNAQMVKLAGLAK